MTTDDLAGILLEHGGSVASEDGRHRECAGCAVVIGLEPRTPRAGMYLAACRELVAAHQAAVIAAAGWVKGREEWAVKHHGYGNAAHYEPCADEEGARRRAALSAWSGYVEPTPARRYVTDWEPA